MSLKSAFRVVLSQGQRVVVEFEGTDGQIEVDFDSRGDKKLEVTADIPDTSGRSGVIYCEDFSSTPDELYRANEAVMALEHKILVSEEE
jgi:hypothetical protein